MNAATIQTTKTKTAFMQEFAAIREKLDMLEALADQRFDMNPDTITWGEVGSLMDLRELLDEAHQLITRKQSC